MQDLAAKALPEIYQLGSEQVKKDLIVALSDAFTGQSKMETNEHKDGEETMLSEFKDNTSTEQKDKIKTYKDFV